MGPKDIIDFWFVETSPAQKWQKDARFDAMLAGRFSEILLAAGRCELFAWRSSAEGRLAEIIVLDQFSRNIHRDCPQAFAQDMMALCLAQEAVAMGADVELTIEQRGFLYLPYMHSESELIHQQALLLYALPGLEESLDFEKKHKGIIDRFGRYPHRNSILGRQSTVEEQAFLLQPGSSF